MFSLNSIAFCVIIILSGLGELSVIKQESSRYYWQPEPYLAFTYWGFAVSFILLYVVFAIEDSIFSYKGLFVLFAGLAMFFLGSRRQMYFKDNQLIIKTWIPFYRQRIAVKDIVKINHQSRHLMIVIRNEKSPRVYLMNQKRQKLFLNELKLLQENDFSSEEFIFSEGVKKS